jgi:hypothetical protein
MARNGFSDSVNRLFERADWEGARRLLEKERAKKPQDHWVLTQLGVTFYEQRRYEDALQLFLASLKLMPECPLTLWNLAGTLDALGNSGEAVRVYTWLLESKTSPEDDPCWESAEWADSLRTDCVYRLGVCFQHLGQKHKAEHCFEQYSKLLLRGIKGTYSLEDVARQIQSLHEGEKPGAARSELKAVKSALKASGIELGKGGRRTPPRFDERELLPGRRAASKK